VVAAEKIIVMLWIVENGRGIRCIITCWEKGGVQCIISCGVEKRASFPVGGEGRGTMHHHLWGGEERYNASFLG